MQLKFYRLTEDKEVVEHDDLMEWGMLFDGETNRVAFTEVADGVSVSTIFLGLDHGHGLSDRPLLFETMSFDHRGIDVEDGFDGSQIRTSTYGEAQAHHEGEVLRLMRILRRTA